MLTCETKDTSLYVDYGHRGVVLVDRGLPIDTQLGEEERHTVTASISHDGVQFVLLFHVGYVRTSLMLSNFAKTNAPGKSIGGRLTY